MVVFNPAQQVQEHEPLLNKRAMTIVVISCIVCLVALALDGYVYLQRSLKATQIVPPPAATASGTNNANAEKITQDATKGVLPSINTTVANPATSANPIKSIKTNPFE